MKQPAPSLPDWIARLVPASRSLIDVGGQRMHVMEQGEGRPVLCLHGNPTWGFLYRKVASQLRDDPYHLVIPDLMGLGYSDKPPADAHTLDHHVSWVATLVQRLDLRDVVLVVQDWGGAIGVGAFLEQPERLGALVVLNTVLGPPKPGFRPTLFHRLAHLPGLSEFLFRGLSFPQRGMWIAQGDKWGISWEEARAYRHPLRDRRTNQGPLALTRMVPNQLEHPSVHTLTRVRDFVQAYEGPARIVWGDRDPVLGKLKRRISRWLPQAEVVSTNAGHYIQEEKPVEIADAIRKVARS